MRRLLAIFALALLACTPLAGPDADTFAEQVEGCWRFETGAADTMPGASFFPLEVLFTSKGVGDGRYRAKTYPLVYRDAITRWWPIDKPRQLRAGRPKADTDLPQPGNTALYLKHVAAHKRMVGWWTALGVELPVEAERCAPNGVSLLTIHER